MLAADLEMAIYERVNKIPIVETLRMKIISLSTGFCEVRVPRRVKYDGVFESLLI